MIEKINNSQIPNILKESSSKQEPSSIPENNQVDASLQVNFDSLIEEAKKIPPEDTNKVKQARELLLSGQLESPEKIQEAAENIVNFGI